LIDANPFLIGAVGLAAGLLGSILGIGGGILIVPVLTLAFHLPIHNAVGSSLVAIVATSSTAAASYVKSGLANVRLGLIMEIPSVLGAIIGALAIVYIAGSVLSALFGALLMYIAFSILLRRNPPPETVLNERNQSTEEAAERSNKGSDWRVTSYTEKGSKQEVSYAIKRLPQGIGVGFVAGIMASLLGIGGGILNVPVMNLVMGVPLKAAIATSSFIIALTTAAGAIVFYFNGYLNPAVIAPLIIGAYLGARLGSYLLQKTTGTKLRYVFSVVMIVMAIFMFLQAAGLNLTSQT
jgi:uncharacterized membrane protein YfcA